MSLHFIDIWVNCPDRETAERIAAACIEERLAACANIFAPIASQYRWKGGVETDEEVPVVLKTRAEHFKAVCDTVRPLHPFEVPSIVATELTHIDQAYADWLREETREPA
ncbi:divalent-cation tolerance protein CutA [Chelativorans sp. YIM 93263]|uniref:divalent-cation tolerance protein CutA n=1 Tax=Chelativorans sp. YIM 93263 TaxID=2906648 RepID=UPI002379BFA1|nr:divalent-cation tolerance protein CutA [Chelativorans sp. YIM 93263]